MLRGVQGKKMEENQNHSDFMKETIKQRPLNRRKLVRRMLLTVAMAVIFGLVACVTFLLLEPVINNKLYPEEEPDPVVFPEEPEENEILPEDMIVDESQMQPEPTPVPVLEEEKIIAQLLSKINMGTDEYLSLTNSLNQVAREVQNSMVSVVGVTSDVGWLDNVYENEGVVSGVIVADNKRELLILADISSIEDADSVKVTFKDGLEYDAFIKKIDNNTGYGIIAISKAMLNVSTTDIVKVVNLGTSAAGGLEGTPVIALGRPTGTEGSICYGNITSTGNSIRLPDSNYKYMTTDIYGSTNASGVLVNLRGQVIGMVDMSYNGEDMKNIISAIGITELKKVVESLSNDKSIAYFGVYGVDVTTEANEALGVPVGAYITEIDMDSPAMDAGIQSGDVVVRINELEIASYHDLVKALQSFRPEETISVDLMREGPEGYTEMEVSAVLSMKNG
ncbi:MAG: S1C family serine protease [Lachnospiraceae bacterium]|nr:S1C family serine protease [Lachnospiraceae bacterium]MDE7008201.1 S1C family serine protease [Lachnospiraceae bacterium]